MTEQPPIEHVEWVFQHIQTFIVEGGSFRKLIYDHMGYGPEAYQRLYEAGGMDIVNALNGDS
jgi:hypothetical protein